MFALSFEGLYGTIAFYLANRSEIDEYLRDGETEFARLRDESRAKNPALYERLRSIREVNGPSKREDSMSRGCGL